jgi:hypothetical protein
VNGASHTEHVQSVPRIAACASGHSSRSIPMPFSGEQSPLIYRTYSFSATPHLHAILAESRNPFPYFTMPTPKLPTVPRAQRRKAPRSASTPGPKPSGIIARAIDEICRRHSEGENMRAILPSEGRAKHLPTAGHWYTAIARDEPRGIAERFARARENWTHSKANECLEIADEPCADNVEVQRNRLRIETRMRLVGKLNRKAYGENVDVTSAGQSVAPIALLPAEMLIKGK